MNREIEFRAWLKKENKMVNVKSIHFGTKKIMYGYSVNSQNYGNKTCKFEDCELMQNTGLCDRNGTKIFEGDVFEDEKNEIRGIVVFGNGSFRIKWFGLQTTLYEYGYDDGGFGEVEFETFDMYNIDQMEVIGNIYDNPELLQQTE